MLSRCQYYYRHAVRCENKPDLHQRVNYISWYYISEVYAGTSLRICNIEYQRAAQYHAVTIVFLFFSILHYYDRSAIFLNAWGSYLGELEQKGQPGASTTVRELRQAQRGGFPAISKAVTYTQTCILV